MALLVALDSPVVTDLQVVKAYKDQLVLLVVLDLLVAKEYKDLLAL